MATRAFLIATGASALHSLTPPAVDVGMRPFCIGIAGGTASGKTTVTEKMVARIRAATTARVASITQDCFYRDLTPEQIESANMGNFNFDHPDAFDFDLSLQVVQRLYSGDTTPVAIPQYDFCSHSRLPRSHDQLVVAPQVVIFEGILALHDARLRELFDLKIFVDADDDIRLARRIKRDIDTRGRDLAGVLRQYETFVKPSFDTYIKPSKRYADIVVPRGGDNVVAIELLAQHVSTLLPAPSHMAVPVAMLLNGHGDAIQNGHHNRCDGGQQHELAG